MIFFFWILLLLTLILIVMYTLKSGKKNIFEPIYYLLLGYLGIFIVEYLKFKDNIISMLGEEVVILGLIYAWLGLIFYYVGYKSSLAKGLGRFAPKPRLTKPGFLMPIGWLLLGFGILGYIAFIQASGGFLAYFSISRGGGNLESSNAYIAGAKWLVVPGLAILYLELSRKKYYFFIRMSIYSIAILYFLFQVWIGQRSGILGVGLLILGLIYLPNNKFKKMPLRNILSASFMFLILVGFVTMFRQDIYYGSEFSEIDKFTSKPISGQVREVLNALGGSEKVSHWERSEVSMYFRYIDAIPDKVDYDYGYYFVNYFVWWIPRSVWPDRPDLRNDKKLEMERAIGTSHLSGPSVTMLGFNYLNFGLLGIIVLMFIYGVLFGSLEYARKYFSNHEYVLLVYLLFFQSGWMDMLGSGFFQSFHVWAPFKLFPLILVALYIKLFANKRFKWS